MENHPNENEDVESSGLMVEDSTTRICDSTKTNDAMDCYVGQIVKTVIESKDVVDIPTIRITAVDEGTNEENLMIAAITETFVKPTDVETADVVGEDANNNLLSGNGDTVENEAANTFVEQNAAKNATHKEVSSSEKSETIIVPNATTESATAGSADVIETETEIENVKKSRISRRNKAKKSKVNLQNQPAVEMATESDIYDVIASPRQRCYQLVVKNAHRKIPADNCEIYCSNIPVNVLEQELIPLFDRYGKIWNVRLLMDRNNQRRNAGFAFVRYTNPISAQEAIKNLNNYEILPGKLLAVRPSQPNLSLFVGNLNRNQSKEQIHAIFSRLVKGVVKTVVKSSFYEADKNCGFCFLEFESHNAAVTARLKLKHSKVWGRQLFVDWSQRRVENTDDENEESNTIFINNLPKIVTDEIIKTKLSTFGEITSVTIIKDYAFVRFQDHDSAVVAMNNFNVKEEFKSDEVELSFALKRPQRNRTGHVRNTPTFLQQQHGFRTRFPRPFKPRTPSIKSSTGVATKPQPADASQVELETPENTVSNEIDVGTQEILSTSTATIVENIN